MSFSVTIVLPASKANDAQAFIRNKSHLVRPDRSGRLWIDLLLDNSDVEECLRVFEKRVWRLFDNTNNVALIENWKRK